MAAAAANPPAPTYLPAPAVEAAFNDGKQKIKAMHENAEEGIDMLTELAVEQEREKETDKVAATRLLVSGFAEQLLSLQAYTTALDELTRSYRCRTDQNTDFAADLEAAAARHTQELAAKPAWQASLAARLRDFDEAVWGVHHSGQPLPGDGPGADEDEDVGVVGGGGKYQNKHCPLTMRPLEELEHPVVDPVGLVYERAAITEYLGARVAGKPCPQHGYMHVVKLDELRDCADLLRQRRRNEKRAGAGGGAGGAGPSAAGGGAGGRSGRAAKADIQIDDEEEDAL